QFGHFEAGKRQGFAGALRPLEIAGDKLALGPGLHAADGGDGNAHGLVLKWPGHSSVALMAFSPQFGPPDRIALRDGSKPLTPALPGRCAPGAATLSPEGRGGDRRCVSAGRPRS